MKRFFSTAIVFAALALMAAPAFAADFMVKLVGKWEGKSTGVDYINQIMDYNSGNITIRILKQTGDRFDGEMIGETTRKFNGVISEGKIFGTADNIMIFADLPFLEGGLYRMAGHYQGFGGGTFFTVKFMVHRTSITP